MANGISVMNEDPASSPRPKNFTLAAIIVILTIAAVGIRLCIEPILLPAEEDHMADWWRSQIAEVKAGGTTTVIWPDPVHLEEFVRDQPEVAAKIDTVMFTEEGKVADWRFGYVAEFPNLKTINFYETWEGVDAFLSRMSGKESITCLSFHLTLVSDAGVAAIASLPKLQELHFGRSGPITDAATVHLARMAQLRKLGLCETQITDKGLIRLGVLTQLEELRLEDAGITDAGLAGLAGLTKLRALYVDNTRITDAGLAKLAGLNQLQRLSLTATNITDAGLTNLAGLTQLQSLWLDSTKVTDAGLATVAGLPQLRKLDLSGTQVTDAGLTQVARLSQLETLSLDDTRITDAGLARLAVLANLQSLSAEHTQISADALKEFKLAVLKRVIDSR
jgi:hypothetical protein